MNEWVKKASPAIHQVLKKHSKRITNQIRVGLESKGFGKADDGEGGNDNSNQADAILSGVDMTSFSNDLQQTLNPILFQIYMNGMEQAAQEVSGSFVRDPVYHQYANDYATQRSAELAGKRVLPDGTIIDNPNPKYALTDSTREMLRNDLVDMMDQGLTPAEIAKNLESDYAFSESRAMTIARTETGFTWNRGAIKMYSEAGVKLLNVHDGDHDEECRAANGQVWSADYASVNALAHPNCLVKGTRVLARNTQASFTRWYEGDVVVLRTSSDLELTVTPNHPILTGRGWVAAGELTERDYIVCDTSAKWQSGSSDNNDMITVVEEVAESFGMTFAVVPTTSEDFHGDGTNGDVCIVRTDGFLFDETNSSVSKHGENSLFIGADVLVGITGGVSTVLEPDSMSDFIFQGELLTPTSILSRCEQFDSLLFGHSLVSVLNGIRTTANNTKFSQPSTNSGSVETIHLGDVIGRQTLSDVKLEQLVISGAIGGSLSSAGTELESSITESFSDGLDIASTKFSETVSSLSGEIALVKIVNIERQFYRGHVYNLQTEQGWYVSNGIITHNCVRSFSPCLEPDAQPDEY